MTMISSGPSTQAVIDPLRFISLCWPHITLYDKQKEILYSLRDNEETIVPAGNGLGKDFITALGAIWFFCSRRPARVVTTSVKSDQLNDVLWGEIRRFIRSTKYSLPIQYNHLHIRQTYKDGTFVPLSELVGQVVNKGEALLGRHLPNDIPRTLAIFDEASGIEDHVYESVDTWAHRKLVIGNCYPTRNFFFKGVKAGDLWSDDKKHCYRRVIRIKAEDSPNVQYGMAEVAEGREPTNRILIPGVVDYRRYKKRRQLWDRARQSIGLDASFYEDESVLMFPPAWLDAAESRAILLSLNGRKGKAIGVDPAEGGDSTAMCCVDEFGILELISEKTPDTSDIPGKVIAFAHKWGVDPENILIDRGGGGKQLADGLRKQGYEVETLAFGESVTPEKRRGLRTLKQTKLDDEDRYTYFNRRAQLYYEARQLIEPSDDPQEQFAIPRKYTELRRQLSPIPILYTGEGRIKMLPKNKTNPNSTEKCLVDLIGHSPDEADSFVLATHRLLYKPKKRQLSVVV